MLVLPPIIRSCAACRPESTESVFDAPSARRRRLLAALPALAGAPLLALGGTAPAGAAELEKGALDELFRTPVVGLDGKPAALAAYRGKRLLVNFWATWCAPCRREMPELAALARERKDLTVLGMAVEEDPKAVGAFLKSMGVGYANVLITPMAGLALMRRLGNTVGGLPYTVVVEANGNPLMAKVGAVTRAEVEGKLPRG
ncbi:TlpA family protein disulfide reductase [Oryzomicrobium sp.]|uniref:TlpA family protein disulfide reductase n=1 Tax=Oryzomicrobium sp. TaxID=1911578 RepID=UPI002FE1D02F